MQRIVSAMRKSFLLIPAVLIIYSAVSGQHIKKPEKNDTLLINSFLSKAQLLAKDFPDSAAHFYQRATQLASEIDNNMLLSRIMSLHIKFLNNSAKFEEALALANQHIELSKKLKDSSLLLIAYNEAANEYEYLGDDESSTSYYIKALKLATATGNAVMQRKLNNNLASVFISLKDYPTAYKYSTRAYKMAELEKDTVTMGNCLINMGISELHQKKYSEALFHFNNAEQIGYRIPDITLVADALSDKGLVYYTQHDLAKAEKSYTEQKKIAEDYHLPYEKLYAVFQLALIAKEKRNLSVAENFASQAIAIGEQLGMAEELMEMYDTMSVIKAQRGQYKDALHYKNKYEAINDSLRNEEVQTNIHHLNIQYRTAQKDKQIAEQNLSIEKTRAAMERKNMWLFVFLAGILALGIILILSLRTYRHKQKLHQQSLMTLRKQHEVNTLKAKMQAREEERNRIGREMHDDIGSALTTILYLSDDLQSENRETALHSANRISDTATAVVDKMNEIIWSMNHEYDTYDDLIAYTRQHAVQFLEDHGLSYHLDIPDPVPQVHLTGEQRRNIYLVIKESLHNIVKHACATEVTIAFRLNENLDVTIQDNGKGFSKTSLFGNGLKNMRQRMQSIGGSFEINNGEGTTVKLSCPPDTNA